MVGGQCSWPVAEQLDPLTLGSPPRRNARGVAVGDVTPGGWTSRQTSSLSPTAVSDLLQCGSSHIPLPHPTPLMKTFCLPLIRTQLYDLSPPTPALAHTKPVSRLLPLWALWPSHCSSPVVTHRLSFPPALLFSTSTLSSSSLGLIASHRCLITCLMTRILQLPWRARTHRRAGPGPVPGIQVVPTNDHPLSTHGKQLGPQPWACL